MGHNPHKTNIVFVMVNTIIKLSEKLRESDDTSLM